MSWKATRNSFVAVAALACMLPAAAQAGWDTHAPERDFVYRGKPIDPRCATALTPNNPKTVALSRCTQRGRIERDGRSYTIWDNAAQEIGPVFDSYKVLAKSGSRFVLTTEWSGGGSGRFSNLVILRKQSNGLSLEKSLAGGDRCNGGLFDAHVVKGTLRWSENVTPSDMITKGGIALAGSAWALEFAAQSCVGTLDWEADLESGDTRLVSETLTLAYFGGTREASTGLIEDQPGWTEQYNAQHCFNAYYNTYVSRKMTHLSVADMKTFATGFAQRCMKSR